MNVHKPLIRELFDERNYRSTFFADRVPHVCNDLTGEFEEWNDHHDHILQAGMLVVFPDREFVVARSEPQAGSDYSFHSIIADADRLINHLRENHNSQDVTATITLRAI